MRLFSLLSIIFLSFSLLTFWSLLSPSFIRAQSTTSTCDCLVEVGCDPFNGGATKDPPPNFCTVVYGEYFIGGLPCMKTCAGHRIDPTIPATAGNCQTTPGCEAVAGCTPCYGKNYLSDQEALSTIKQYCESGAYCGHFNPVPVGAGQISGEPGLFSTLFKKCFCGFGDFIQTIVNIGYSVVGTLALVMFVIGGIKYMTARNDPEKLVDAKETLLFAVAGLMFVLLSVALLSFLDVQLAPWGIRFLVYS